jgi:ketol-acid reductoisomerase
MSKIDLNVIGKKYDEGLSNSVDNQVLVAVNAAIRNHPVEEIGIYLRGEMAGMKAIAVG